MNYFILGVCVGIIATGLFWTLIHMLVWLLAPAAFVVLLVVLARMGFQRWRRGSWI